MTPSFFLFFSPKFGAPVTYIQVVENDVVSLGIFILRQAVAGWQFLRPSICSQGFGAVLFWRGLRVFFPRAGSKGHTGSLKKLFRKCLK